MKKQIQKKENTAMPFCTKRHISAPASLVWRYSAKEGRLYMPSLTNNDYTNYMSAIIYKNSGIWPDITSDRFNIFLSFFNIHIGEFLANRQFRAIQKNIDKYLEIILFWADEHTKSFNNLHDMFNLMFVQEYTSRDLHKTEEIHLNGYKYSYSKFCTCYKNFPQRLHDLRLCINIIAYYWALRSLLHPWLCIRKCDADIYTASKQGDNSDYTIFNSDFFVDSYVDVPNLDNRLLGQGKYKIQYKISNARVWFCGIAGNVETTQRLDTVERRSEFSSLSDEYKSICAEHKKVDGSMKENFEIVTKHEGIAKMHCYLHNDPHIDQRIIEKNPRYEIDYRSANYLLPLFDDFINDLKKFIPLDTAVSSKCLTPSLKDDMLASTEADIKVFLSCCNPEIFNWLEIMYLSFSYSRDYRINGAISTFDTKLNNEQVYSIGLNDGVGFKELAFENNWQRKRGASTTEWELQNRSLKILVPDNKQTQGASSSKCINTAFEEKKFTAGEFAQLQASELQSGLESESILL